MKAESANTKQRWESPRVETLPRLIDLTLQTGGGIPGGDTRFGVGYKS